MGGTLSSQKVGCLPFFRWKSDAISSRGRAARLATGSSFQECDMKKSMVSPLPSGRDRSYS